VFTPLSEMNFSIQSIPKEGYLKLAYVLAFGIHPVGFGFYSESTNLLESEVIQ
jgi:hypothetical protein